MINLSINFKNALVTFNSLNLLGLLTAVRSDILIRAAKYNNGNIQTTFYCFMLTHFLILGGHMHLKEKYIFLNNLYDSNRNKSQQEIVKMC